MRHIVLHVLCSLVGGTIFIAPLLSAWSCYIDPVEDLAFRLQHPVRWCVRHPIKGIAQIVNRRRTNRGGPTWAN
jgi:hypothetical protein